MSRNFLNIKWNLFKNKNKNKPVVNNESTGNNIVYERPLTYFVPPPVISSNFVYQDVNKDFRLREKVTIFFLKKTIKWINKYSEFEKSKYLLPTLETDTGHELIYNLLRQFIKKNNCNWYDLKNKYELVKDFIRYKLNKYKY